jgi:hypothetical protein
MTIFASMQVVHPGANNGLLQVMHYGAANEHDCNQRT